MKKYCLLFLLSFSIVTVSVAQRSANDEISYHESNSAASKLNTKRFEKYLDQHKDKLDLSRQQVKELNKIERRYARKDRKLSRHDAKKRDHQNLAKQKREEMLDALTIQQQDQLQALIKKGRFSLDQIFGK